MTHHCPSCGAGLISEPIGSPLRCKSCRWRLFTLAEWQAMTPFRRGYAWYMQSSWPTSPLEGEKNPYVDGTPECAEFHRGERAGVAAAQDSEE